MKLNEFPKTPSEEEWDRLKASSDQQPLVLVQISERRYRIGTRSYIRNKELVIPWIRVSKFEPTFTWLEGLTEIERRMHERRAAQEKTAG